jgi:NADP-dependent 3-hydroxy acid dehydrogenase YdfG
MADGLRGTVALVTGASSGIGAATAAALARDGASVALVARRRDRLEAVAAGIKDAGGDALVVEADITSQAHAAAAVERTVAEFHRLDTVVNNAGLMLLGPVAEAPDGEWERMIAVNLTAVLHVTKAALPHLWRAAEAVSYVVTRPRRVAVNEMLVRAADQAW